MKIFTKTTAVPAALVTGVLLSAYVSGADSAAETPPPSQPDTMQAAPAPGGGIIVTGADDRDEMAGPAETFTGNVVVEMLTNGDDSAVQPGLVSFQPGARTAWHTHPAGQRLIITQGTGWVQDEGGERLTVSAGDVVWFAPGVKHWHGATDSEPMTHIAIAEDVNGSGVDWMEHVTDEQYTAARN